MTVYKLIIERKEYDYFISTSKGDTEKLTSLVHLSSRLVDYAKTPELFIEPPELIGIDKMTSDFIERIRNIAIQNLEDMVKFN